MHRSAPVPVRATVVLFVTAALLNAAISVAGPPTTIVAAERLGAAWAGVPVTAGIVGAGLGAVGMTWAASRWSWRLGLTAGYLAATAGAGLGALGMAGGSVAALSAGMLLLGLGAAGALLSRYTAAQLYPPGRRGFAIGIIVWAGAAGAVGGPLLLVPTTSAARGLDVAATAGPFLFAVVAAGTAALAVRALPPAGRATVAPAVPLRSLARGLPARSALLVMATSQVVMIALMTVVPLTLHAAHHHGPGALGYALSAHTSGMFALSPLTGWILDRTGPRPVMLTGLVVMALATVATATAPYDHQPVRLAVLFALGYGWNLCFVGGSGGLVGDVHDPRRPQVEGAVDAAVWALAAGGSLTSAVLLSTGGYALLAGLATAIVGVALGTLLLRR